MILLDFETTGLLAPAIANIETQPHIVEIAVIKTGTKNTEFQKYVKPPIAIPKVVQEIHGITDEKVANEKPFATYIPKLQELFVGETVICGHNVAFDIDVLYYELLRVGHHNRFPYPFSLMDTNILAKQKIGRHCKLTELYEIVTGKPHKTAHTALGDLKAVMEILKVWGLL